MKDITILERSAAEPTPRPPHPIATDTLVFVFRIALFRRPFIEGEAVIEGPIAGIPDFYRVRLAGDAPGRIRERFVYPEYQIDPERMLAILIGQWREAMTPEVLEEFFPDDLI